MLQDKAFWFGVISVVVNTIGYFPYIKGILKGVVKPQRITWGIWSILTTVAFVNQIHNGGGYSTYFFGSTCILVIIVFTLSIFKGVGGSSKFDIAVLLASLALFILWAVSRDTRYTTLIAICIDAIAALPTVFKAFKRPETEAYLQWILAAVSGGFSILAVANTDYILFAYPAYIVFMNAVIVLAKYTGTKKLQAT